MSTQQTPTPKRRIDMDELDSPLLNATTLSGLALLTSIGISLGAFYLVSQDGKEQMTSKHYMSLPNDDNSAFSRMPRYSTNGDAGAGAVTIEAFSVGEQISPEGLRLRFEFEDDVSNKDKKKRHMHVIGKGAYGKVVSAIDRNTGNKVAMKVVPHTAMTAESLLEEVEVLRRVRGHDNIIHLLDVMYCAGNYYLVTELCEGGEVLDHLFSNGPFKEPQAAYLMRRIASALRHIHKCGYVHLDVKPENIVFTGKTNDDEARLIDFGMARKITEVAGHLSMVKNDKRSRLGTLAYWAPEQVRTLMSEDGRKLSDVDFGVVQSDPRACDMWALGVVLYIMLLGCHPFDQFGKGNEREMAKAIMKRDLKFNIHGDKLKISEDAKDLISGLLDPDPNTRYTAYDVIQHPFVRLGMRNDEQILPTSWTQQGYNVKRDSDVDKLVQNADNDPRLRVFNTKRVGDSFARVLLMAVVMNAKNNLRATSENPPEPITADKLFRDAFEMFDPVAGKITIPSIERLLKATGDEAEDEVVTSYHTVHDLKKKAENSAVSSKVPEPPIIIPSEGSEPRATGKETLTFQEFKAFLRKQDCVARSFLGNERVLAQGTVPQGFYVLLSGKAQLVYEETSSGSKVIHPYATLMPTNFVGETALVKGEKQRFVSVWTQEDSDVVYIPKDVFLGALAGSPALFESLFKVAMNMQAHRLHELIAHLKPEGVVVEHHDAGDTLFKQGDPADSLYLIQEGIIGTNTEGKSSRAKGAESMSVRIAERGAGDLIGTSAASGGGGMRYSTAECLTPVTVLVMPNHVVSRLRKEDPLFRFYLGNLIQARKEFWQTRIADLERGVSEPQLLPLLLHQDREKPAKPTGAAVAAPKVAEIKPVVQEIEAPVVIPEQPKRSRWSYLNPWSWWRSEKPSTPAEIPEPEKNELGGLMQQVIDEHMDTFESYARAINRMKKMQFKAGDYVTMRGERPKGFFIVDTGTVSVQFKSDSGKLLTMANLSPGDHFGEAALLEGIESYVTSVRCVTDAEVLIMDKSEFDKLCGDGTTTFATAIRTANKLRQHRWVRNLLKLAKEDKRRRRVEAHEKRLKLEQSRKRTRDDVSRHLIEMDDNDEGFHFFDRDDDESQVIKKGIEKMNANFGDKGHTEKDRSEKGVQEVGRLFYHPGETLFRAGEPLDAIYMVHRGSFRVTSKKGDRVLNPGDTYGLERVGRGATYTETATCVEANSIVSRIPLTTIDRLIEDHEFVSEQLRRHARRAVPLNELERRSKMDMHRRKSFREEIARTQEQHRESRAS